MAVLDDSLIVCRFAFNPPDIEGKLSLLLRSIEESASLSLHAFEHDERRGFSFLELQGAQRECDALRARVMAGYTATRPSKTGRSDESEERFVHLKASAEAPLYAGEDRQSWVLTLLGTPLSPAALREGLTLLARKGVKLVRSRSLASNPLRALEWTLLLEAEALPGLREDILRLRDQHPALDLGLERSSPARRFRRLLVMDVDSTLIEMEVIDELARMHGVQEAVSTITRRAMEGELDFEQSLRKRVAMLEGLSVESMLSLVEKLPVNPGAASLFRALRAMGCKSAIVSGGFLFAVEALREKLGIDVAYANDLEIVSGKLSGALRGDIVGPHTKAEVLERLARESNADLTQTIAVGDGANDVEMIQRAGLGVAYDAKAFLRKHADATLQRGGLERVLHYCGIDEDEIEALSRL